MNTWYITPHTQNRIPIEAIPVLSYAQFYADVQELLGDESFHPAHYFGVPEAGGIVFYCLLLDDRTGGVWVASWRADSDQPEEYPSLTALFPTMHPFEREITELFGLSFKDNPFDKPLRFARERWNHHQTINNYPFYRIDSPSLHEVNVGPIHAGIIEPGAFRFICNGEQILHLEIVLGYQHRGLERAMVQTTNRLRQATLAESIAGDSTVSHSWAYARLIESLAEMPVHAQLERERSIAQELERIAIHLGDTGALCMDVGFQLGQVACEALRTLAINTTQRLCGNRFGRTLIRPGGTRYPLTEALRAAIIDNVKEIRRRYTEVCEDLLSTPSVLGRFEECGKVTRQQMARIGAVGLAARASGLPRDIRQSHPYGAYTEAEFAFTPVLLETGDVLARTQMRYRETLQSIHLILHLLRDVSEASLPLPDTTAPLKPRSLCFSLIEGWRGEICHIALTDARGELSHYKVKDPSLHNWYALSLAVRGAGISDFPVNNKSFNLSYCGHDL
jgi:Ni,Fe-hydrogenase III large subunit